jgi:WD40 repeat protein
MPGSYSSPDDKPRPVAHDSAGDGGLRIFVVHAPEDAWFVEGFLLEALNLRDGEVLVSNKLDLGAVVVNEIERGALSPVTLVVLSPAFLASPWAQFASRLATHQSVEAANDGSATLIPAILADCELPLLSRFRVALDFRNHQREHWETEAAKLRKRVAAPAPVVALVPCPYPGIRPFTTEDAARFHGRNKEVTDLLGRLRDGQRELYVIGPSGSGKSSLVAAGLLPSLRFSPELAGGSFLVRQMRPGAKPMAGLASVLEATDTERSDVAMPWLGDAVGRLLATHRDHDRLLILVDQLEELFTTAEPDAHSAFIAAIRQLRGDSRVAFVFTLRADFYASLMESPLWADLDGQLSRFDVGPLRGDKLRMAIEAPARALGVYFEPVLVERLLNDVADEPGALPLLQDTLLDLWHQRTRGLLRLAEYDAMSDGAQTGLAVTVARHANAALNDLSPDRREIARRVLLRLVQFGDGTAITRRQQPRAALSTAGDAPSDIDAVIRHLADRRLLTTSGGDDVAASARVDLAHEVLLSAWPALGEWIRSRREDEQRRRVLEGKAAEWVTSGRGQSRLLDADELREVRSWLGDDKARDLGVSEEIQSLLASSEAALAALVAEAEDRSREASRQRARLHISEGHGLLTSGKPAQAAPHLLAAREAGAEDISLRTLFRWAARGLPLLQLVHSRAIKAVAWSPDGRRVATASMDGTVGVWDAGSGKSVTTPLKHRGGVLAVAWSPDGRRLATASNETVQVWDAVSGRAATLPLKHRGEVKAVVWSPDGTRVATASVDGTARVWDAVSGQAVAPPLAHQDEIKAVAWSPDGTRLATASNDQTARVWDAVSGEAMLVHQDEVRAVAWSPDGKLLATASADETARVWDAVSGEAVTPALAHRGVILAVAWSPDGTCVATASVDGTARVWNAVSGQPVTPSLVHQGWIRAVAWSPDGRQVATASDDRTAGVWDAVSGEAVTRLLAHQGEVRAVAWSPDGTRVATASAGKTARVWDAVTGQAVTPPLVHSGRVLAVAWSPDGRRLATACGDQTARVWDVSWDTGTLADWRAALERCDYCLNADGALDIKVHVQPSLSGANDDDIGYSFENPKR